MHAKNPKNIVPKGDGTPLKLQNGPQDHERDRKAFIWGGKTDKKFTNEVRLSEIDPANKFKYTINLIDGGGICREAYFEFSGHRVSSEQTRRRIKNDSNLRRVYSMNHCKIHLIFNS